MPYCTCPRSWPRFLPVALPSGLVGDARVHWSTCDRREPPGYEVDSVTNVRVDPLYPSTISAAPEALRRRGGAR